MDISKKRNYTHEQELRNKRKIRFVFEFDIKRGKELKEYLSQNNITLIQWIRNQTKDI